MRFVVKKEIFEELPSACFGVVMAKGIDNNNAYPEKVSKLQCSVLREEKSRKIRIFYHIEKHSEP